MNARKRRLFTGGRMSAENKRKARAEAQAALHGATAPQVESPPATPDPEPAPAEVVILPAEEVEES